MIITREKNLFIYNGNFEVLYNLQGAAKIAWLPWPKGTDSSCNLRLGRCNDGNEHTMVDEEGYVYYQNGVSDDQCCWYWDDNEYDLLIEKIVVKVELLDIKYESPRERKTKKSSGSNAAATEGWRLNYKDRGSSERSTTLSVSHSNSVP